MPNGSSTNGASELLLNGNLSKRSRSNSRSSDCTLDDSDEEEEEEVQLEQTAHILAASAPPTAHESISLSNGNSHLLANMNNLLQSHPPASNAIIGSGIIPASNGHVGTTTAILLNSTSTSASSSSSNQSTAREAQINQLYAQVHKDPSKQQQQQQQHQASSLFKTALGSPADAGGGLNDFHRGSMTTFGTASNRDLNSSYDSIVGSNDKLAEANDQGENWMYPSRRRVAPNGTKLPGSSFTDQLNQALSDRERWVITQTHRHALTHCYTNYTIRSEFCRRLGDGSSRHSSDDYTEINKNQSAAAINCKTLINEIRQAVNEAQPKGEITIK